MKEATRDKGLVLVNAETPAMPPFSEWPAALLPFGSRPVIEHLVGALVAKGWSRIIVQAGARRSLLAALLDEGRPWSIQLEVVERATPAQRAAAALRVEGHRPDIAARAVGRIDPASFSLHSLENLASANLALLEGRCPDVDEPAILAAAGFRRATHRVRISRKARIIGPVILGENVVIRAGASVGPYVIATSNVVIDRAARLSHSLLAGGFGLERGGECRGAIALSGRVLPSELFGATPRERGLRTLGQRAAFFGLEAPLRDEAPRVRTASAAGSLSIEG